MGLGNIAQLPCCLKVLLENRLRDAANGRADPSDIAAFAEWLAETPQSRIAQNRQAADLLFHRVGITFAVYGEASGTERLPVELEPPPAGSQRGLARLRAALDETGGW